jgi:hypothetical protein
MNQKLVALVVLTLCFACSLAHAADRYAAPVPVGLGDGSSWANAGILPTAVAGATAGCTVWVSNGTYQLANQLTITNFTIKSFGANGAVDRDGTIINGNNYVGKAVTNRCFTLSHANAVVEGLTITNGYVTALGGGGVYMSAGTLRNCLVIGNVASNISGGGVFATGSGSMVTNCDVIGNTVANGNGGGMNIESSAQIWNSRVIGNRGLVSSSGGGLRIVTGTMVNCQVVSNTTASMTGGAFLHGTVTIRNCLIMGNGRGSLTASAGFGSHAWGSLNAYIENCTITANKGAGIFTQAGGGNYYLKNTVCHLNDDPTIKTDNGVMVLTNCCVSSTNNMTTGSGNTTAVPSFIWRAGADYRLAPWSAGVDTGLVLAWMNASSLDLAGQPRISANNLPDMGAYETTAGPSINYYVARRGQSPVLPYTNGWGSAASNIQDVLSVMSDGATILVTNGIYPLANQLVVENTTIRSFNNGAVDRDGTIIDGDNYVGKSVTNRCMVISNALALVEGFTITNGAAPSATCVGGGVYVTAGTLRNCLVTGNHVTNNVTAGLGKGGGVYADGSGIGTNCDIIGNKMWYNGAGGGVYMTGSAKLWNCRIINNGTPTTSSSLVGSGGGVYMTGAGPVIENSIISSNSVSTSASAANGGGVYMYGGGTLRNCLITRNSANSGAGVCVGNPGAVLDNCTITANTTGNGAFTTVYSGGNLGVLARLNNTICYSNFTTFQVVNNLTPTNSLLTNCCVTSTNNLIGTGNITNNPQFADFAAGNFQLAKTSPCVNTGTNQVWMTGALDLVGAPRLDWRDGLVDMGAYEYVPLRPSGTLMMIR